MLFFTLRKVESNALLLRFPPTDNPRPPPPPSKIPHPPIGGIAPKPLKLFGDGK